MDFSLTEDDKMSKTADFLKQMESEFAKFQEDFPNHLSGWGTLSSAVKAPGALDRKTKELIALAIGIYTHCEWCIDAHIRYALAYGATKEEVLEASWVAVLMGGGPSLQYLLLARKALEDLST